MFKYLFDLSYERNLDEAKVFYCFYIFLGYYIAGLLNYFVDTYPSIYKYGPFIFFVPFIFYMFVSISIVLKKHLKDSRNIYLIFYLTIVTFFAPLLLGFAFGFGFLGYDGGFRFAIQDAFMICFFPVLVVGGIPVAILSTKEDLSLKKEIQQMEKEKLEQEIKVEKQLLIERSVRMQQEELKNNTIEDNGKSI